jgi:hypothetical protein
MCFIVDTANQNKMVASEDIPVFKKLKDDLKSDSFFYCYKVGEATPKVYLRFVDTKIDVHKEVSCIGEGYHSWRAPEPGYYRFIIPKGAEFYYTINDSLQYVSDRIKLVSDKPLTEAECVEICNFPKTYVEACERLDIKPLDEERLADLGLSERVIALKKLETVIKCIKWQYGIEEYDFENQNQEKWFGLFFMNSPFRYHSSICCRDTYALTYAGCSSCLHLPFAFAARYVCSLNREFFELWKTYML